MWPIWRPAVPLRLQVRPLRLLVRLPYRQGQVLKNPLLNNWVTPSVIQGALPEQRLGSQPFVSGQQYTAAQPYTAAAPPYIAPYNNMPAMSARPTEPMGYFGQGGQLPFVLTEEQLLQQQQLLREKQEFVAWRTSRAQAKTQPQPEIISEGSIPAEVNVEVNVDSSERSASAARARPKDQVTKKAKAKRAGSASTSQRSPSPKRDYPRGTCTVTRPSRA